MSSGIVGSSSIILPVSSIAIFLFSKSLALASSTIALTSGIVVAKFILAMKSSFSSCERFLSALIIFLALSFALANNCSSVKSLSLSFSSCFLSGSIVGSLSIKSPVSVTFLFLMSCAFASSNAFLTSSKVVAASTAAFAEILSVSFKFANESISFFAVSF